ncbi:MAG TPA: hypothetical protein VFZ76_04165 [Anaerolineales bacterium]
MCKPGLVGGGEVAGGVASLRGGVPGEGAGEVPGDDEGVDGFLAEGAGDGDAVVTVDDEVHVTAAAAAAAANA